jgi:ribosome-associated translation inhibitor RaiA
MIGILHTPEKLDDNFEEYQSTYKLKSIKKDGKVKVFFTATVRVNDKQETINTQATATKFEDAFNKAVEKMNKKAKEKNNDKNRTNF